MTEFVPQHCGKSMYHDWHNGEDMRRFLCAEPGCQTAVAEDTLSAAQDMVWADQHGILLPGVKIIGGEETGRSEP
jgi:hypothetical protein